jgi:hypothetical protein
MDGWDFMEEMKLLEYLNIKYSSVYITRSSIAVEDKKKSKNYPTVLGYIIPARYHALYPIDYIQRLKCQTVNQLLHQLN